MRFYQSFYKWFYFGIHYHDAAVHIGGYQEKEGFAKKGSVKKYEKESSIQVCTRKNCP